MLRKFLPLFLVVVVALLVAIAFVIASPFLENEDDSGEVAQKEKQDDFQTAMRKKMNEIRLPELKLHHSTVEETIEFLRLKSIECDPSQGDHSNRGIGFVVRSARSVSYDDGESDDVLDRDDGFGDTANPNATLLTLEAFDIGLADALDLVCSEAGLKWQVDPELLKIVIFPADPDREMTILPELLHPDIAIRDLERASE